MYGTFSINQFKVGMHVKHKINGDGVVIHPNLDSVYPTVICSFRGHLRYVASLELLMISQTELGNQFTSIEEEI
jgi:hypothetical protein